MWQRRLFNLAAAGALAISVAALVFSYVHSFACGHTRRATEAGQVVVHHRTFEMDRGFLYLRSTTVRPASRGGSLNLSHVIFGWTSEPSNRGFGPTGFGDFVGRTSAAGPWLYPTYRAIYVDHSKWEIGGLGITSGWELTIPLWYFVVLSSLPASLAAYRAVRRRRARAGASRFCVTCGYDLRATPERCPECGTAVPRRGAAS